jgi:peptidyl-prolyl cis-trans isomerase C
MMFFKTAKYYLVIIALFALMLASGCRATGSPTVSPVASSPSAQPGDPAVTPPAPESSPTTAPSPTPTPEPLAARVNGEQISLAEYQAELALLQQAHTTLGKTVTAEEQSQQVLDNLIDGLLLAQGAAESGHVVDDAALLAAVDALGADAVQAWFAANGYSEVAFRAALRRQIAAAWQRDQITAAVPTEAEQVHARQILTIDENIATQAHQYVTIPGTNFATYAYQYDAQTGGDLGWFPRGYLMQAEVEEAAFSLQPGQISPVIKSSVGFHIVQVIAVEPARVISPDARRVLQHKALQAWLKARREASQVEVLIP